MKIFLFLLISLIYLGKGILSGQTTRNIQIAYTDSVVRTSILTNDVKINTISNIHYYWYYGNRISQNEGSYCGKLLHGKYEMFDNEQKLRAQGNFKQGVMNGKWTRWYTNGNIQFFCFYDKGQLSGEMNTYTSDGRIVMNSHWKKGIKNGKCEIYQNGLLAEVLSYKHGLLNGKCYYFLPDTIIKVYHEGKEKIKPVKAKTEIKKVAKTNTEELKTENKKIKKWWPF